MEAGDAVVVYSPFFEAVDGIVTNDFDPEIGWSYDSYEYNEAGLVTEIRTYGNDGSMTGYAELEYAAS